MQSVRLQFSTPEIDMHAHVKVVLITSHDVYKHLIESHVMHDK